LIAGYWDIRLEMFYCVSYFEHTSMHKTKFPRKISNSNNKIVSDILLLKPQKNWWTYKVFWY